MLGAIEFVCVDVAVLVGLWLGVGTYHSGVCFTGAESKLEQWVEQKDNNQKKLAKYNGLLVSL